MSRRPAQITQSDVARVIRAAKQADASEVVIDVRQQLIVVRLNPSTGSAGAEKVTLEVDEVIDL